MTATLVRLKGNIEKKQITIKGKGNLRIGKSCLLLEERIKGNDLFTPRDIRIPCTMKFRGFAAEFDLTYLSELQNSLDLWDCYFINGNTKEPITIQQTDFKSYRILYGFLNITFYQNSRHTLSISVKKNDLVNAQLLDLSRSGEKYQFSGTLLDCDGIRTDNAMLAVRKRDNKDSMQYVDEVNFPLTLDSEHHWAAEWNQSSVFINPDILHEEVWDLFVMLERNEGKDHLYLPLHTQLKIQDDYSVLSSNTFYQAKLYLNRKKCVGLWVKRIPHVQDLKGCEFGTDGNLTFTCSNQDHKSIIGARLEPSRSIWSDKFRAFSMEGIIEHHLTNSRFIFPIRSLVDRYKEEKGDIFTVEVLVKDQKSSSETWMPFFIENDPLSPGKRVPLSNMLDAIISRSSDQSVQLKLTEHLNIPVSRVEPVRISVLGTCYTRGAFGSNPYFNPGYKSKYNLVYTQFHSSIPSLMSEPLPYPADYFKDRKPIEQAYISCDFEKTFFKQLSEAHGEYFLFDLYPDAVRDLVIFDDKHIITGSFYLRNRYYLQSIKDSSHFVSHDDEDQFLDYWCRAVRLFAAKIVQYFPEEKIILQKARMTDRYYDAAHHVRYFNDQLDLVKRSNMYFQFMESYLFKLLPHIRTIDLNHYGYIGQYNHPFGQSTNHYEPAYYKKLIEKLDELVAGVHEN